MAPPGVAAAATSASTSDDQWRVFLGLALLVAAYVFRVEVVRFTLRLARRVFPAMFVWIKEFEKNLLRPLSWVVFLLLVWFGCYVMDLPKVLGISPSTITSLITLLLGFPLIWVVICLCNYVTWGIIRIQGWKRTATKDEDDYSRVMIVTEGIGVIKFLLVATVISAFMVDEIGQITSFDSTQITTVAVIMVEFVFVFGAHSWMKNIMGGLMALQDEQVKSGSHVAFRGHEGIVERLYLQGFSLRQYDKGLAYIPNGALLENTITVQSKSLDRRCVVTVHLSHKTKSSEIRVFIQELDSVMLRLVTEKQQRKNKTNVLGLDRRRRTHWDDILNKVQRSHLLGGAEEEEEQPQQRFWISIEAAYVVHLTYYSQERHMKQLMGEKTEVVLQVIELLTKLHIELHNPIKSSVTASPAAMANTQPAPTARSRATRPASSPHISTDSIEQRRDLRFGPATDPRALNRLRRNPGNDRNDALRRRRPQSSTAITLI